MMLQQMPAWVARLLVPLPKIAPLLLPLQVLLVTPGLLIQELSHLHFRSSGAAEVVTGGEKKRGLGSQHTGIQVRPEYVRETIITNTRRP